MVTDLNHGSAADTQVKLYKLGFEPVFSSALERSTLDLPHESTWVFRACDDYLKPLACAIINIRTMQVPWYRPGESKENIDD